MLEITIWIITTSVSLVVIAAASVVVAVAVWRRP